MSILKFLSATGQNECQKTQIFCLKILNNPKFYDFVTRQKHRSSIKTLIFINDRLVGSLNLLFVLSSCCSHNMHTTRIPAIFETVYFPSDSSAPFSSMTFSWYTISCIVHARLDGTIRQTLLLVVQYLRRLLNFIITTTVYYMQSGIAEEFWLPSP